MSLHREEPKTLSALGNIVQSTGSGIAGVIKLIPSRKSVLHKCKLRKLSGSVVLFEDESYFENCSRTFSCVYDRNFWRSSVRECQRCVGPSNLL